MKQALILHGTAASPEANWFRWLERSLIQNGYTVWLPQLPHAEAPNTDTYNTFIFTQSDFKINHETILIGHSSGAVEILSLLQHLPANLMVSDVYLVSAFKNNLDWPALDGLFNEPYDYDAIRKKATSITLIHSDNDPYVPLDHAQFLADKLSANLRLLPGQGHFNTEQSADYREFPKLLELILHNDKDQS